MISNRIRMRESMLEEATPQDRWILSYADFITLLLAFFVVMYSISSVNDGKFRVLSDSMVSTFQETIHRPPPIDLGGGESIVEQTVIATESTNSASMRLLENVALEDGTFDGDSTNVEYEPGPVSAESLKQKMEQTLAPFIEGQEVKVRDSGDWIEVELNSKLLFDSGSPRLSSTAQPLLSRMARIASGIDTAVRVEGFTDNVPISGGPYDSNWQLSAARAASVVDHFGHSGVNPEQMSAVGYGEYHPTADNATAEGRRKNRRVVVALAKHPASGLAGPVGAELAQGNGAKDVLPLRTLQRVTQLPGPVEIN
jgi:chemotaxis protein MotB